MTENDIRRIVAETLAKVSSDIHTSTTTTQTQTVPKRNGFSIASLLVPLAVSVIIAVVGWTLYAGERTSDLAHNVLSNQIASEAAARTVEDMALVKQLDIFTNLVSGMRDDISALKAQMSILMGKMK